MQTLHSLSLALLVVSPVLCFGQELASSEPAPNPVVSSEAAALISPAPKANSNTAPAWQASLNRWVELREMDFSLRYRSVFDSNNAHDITRRSSAA